MRFVRRHAGIALGHRALNLDRAAHRIDDARKLNQEPIAGGLDDATAMFGDLRVAELAADRPQCGESSFLVGLHQPRIARHVGRQDRRQPPFDALSLLGIHGLMLPRIAYSP